MGCALTSVGGRGRAHPARSSNRTMWLDAAMAPPSTQRNTAPTFMDGSLAKPSVLRPHIATAWLLAHSCGQHSTDGRDATG